MRKIMCSTFHQGVNWTATEVRTILASMDAIDGNYTFHWGMR